MKTLLSKDDSANNICAFKKKANQILNHLDNQLELLDPTNGNIF